MERGSEAHMKETTESRAVKCRKTYVDDGVCEKCIRKWLMKKAQKELEKGIGR